jgi:hypothetical protein
MRSKRETEGLADVIFGDAGLTLEELVAAAGREPALPKSNLIPWPDSEELCRLAERAAARRDKKI